ncbi:MAG: type IV secretory system conjugative DNA transfer family protein [Lachnospiraceae bacterium]|nr:type IV secretory system conjugative DNA transfer family protein [Lachnospiraceae bacterium]
MKGELIISKECRYDLDDRKTCLNNNVLVVGTSGSGKTRSIVSPNILKAEGSYVISDPKRSLYQKYGKYLKQKGYKVKCLDFTRPETGSGWNFFDYIHNEQDAVKAAHMIVYSGPRVSGSSREDPFWNAAAENLLSGLIDYLNRFFGDEGHTIRSILDLAMKADVGEDWCSDMKNELDELMEREERIHGKNQFCFRQYRQFRTNPPKTLKCVLTTIFSVLGSLDTPAVRQMMLKKSDRIKLRDIGKERTAVFVSVSDTDRSMDIFANLFFTQAMNELCLAADEECEDRRLPVDVRFILDDFATNVKIDEFPRMIASIRSRGISTMLMIQAESQLVSAYDTDKDTIINNCDTYVYLGGNDVDTAEAVAKRCNKPLHSVLEMPVGTNWVFRRGNKPVNGVNFDLNAFEEELLNERAKRSRKKDERMAG